MGENTDLMFPKCLLDFRSVTYIIGKPNRGHRRYMNIPVLDRGTRNIAQKSHAFAMAFIL